MTTPQIIIMGLGAWLLATAPFEKRFAMGACKCLIGIAIVVLILRSV